MEKRIVVAGSEYKDLCEIIRRKKVLIMKGMTENPSWRV